MTSAEQTRTYQTSAAGAKVSHIHRTHNDVIENSWQNGATSKPSSSRSTLVWLGNAAPSHPCEAATATCSIEPLVVNPVYGSDDCSTLKSLSFEKKNPCLRDYTSTLSQVLHASHERVSDSVSDRRTSLSSADEEKRVATVTVTPAISDCAAEENFTFPEYSAGESAGSYGCTAVSHRESETCNDEARNVCEEFEYRKVCVYLQEGTWRHSPHSLHCIRIDDQITLVVLCEVILLSLLLTAMCFVTKGVGHFSPDVYPLTIPLTDIFFARFCRYRTVPPALSL